MLAFLRLIGVAAGLNEGQCLMKLIYTSKTGCYCSLYYYTDFNEALAGVVTGLESDSSGRVPDIHWPLTNSVRSNQGSTKSSPRSIAKLVSL